MSNDELPVSENDAKLLQKYSDLLSEHWDCIQIVVSRYDPLTKQTITAAAGTGNYNARVQQCRSWVNKCDYEEGDSVYDTENGED